MTTKSRPKLNLVEKFFSVQGEGFNAGAAAFFIRFAGCNLDCVFADGSICDTPWRKANEHITIEELGWWMENELVSAGTKQLGWLKRPLVILTGGEPTFAPGFDVLVECLALKFPIALETNGTRWRESLGLIQHIVVSPKADVNGGEGHVDPQVYAMATEMRHVIAGQFDPPPPINPYAKYHYVSPALEADGAGMEHLADSPPQFVPGAVERCIEIVQQDPRWRISLQTHKWLRVR